MKMSDKCEYLLELNYYIHYDREQIRQTDRSLGKKGQKRLREAKVALLGTSQAGILALKSLVIPGVGHIEIWAMANVQLEDLNTYFFYLHQDIGRPKAEALLKNLIKINPKEVQGKAHVCNPLEILKDEEKLKEYSLLICGDLLEKENIEVSQVCYRLNVPVIFITVVGFYTYVRSQARLHFVESENISSKKSYYMRLHDPFPALQKYSSQWDIAKMVTQLARLKTKEQRSPILQKIKYVPYPIILLQIYAAFPENQRSNQHVLNKIKEYSLIIGKDHRQNFNEAAMHTLDLFQTADIFLPDISIFDNPHVASANADSPIVLQFLRTCAHFYKTTGGLPQPTHLPNIHTSINLYMEPKQVYRQEHDLDVRRLQTILRELIGSDKLTNGDISQFIDNLHSLRIIEFTEYAQELRKVNNPNLPQEAPEWRNILLALRAFQIFQGRERRAPTPQDLGEVKWIAEGIKKDYGFEEISDDSCLRAVTRKKDNMMMSIYSIGGGLGGQEAVKLVTHSFIPVKNGQLYQGVHPVGQPVDL